VNFIDVPKRGIHKVKRAIHKLDGVKLIIVPIFKSSLRAKVTGARYTPVNIKTASETHLNLITYFKSTCPHSRHDSICAAVSIFVTKYRCHELICDNQNSEKDIAG
jgi:hypothetical protein